MMTSRLKFLANSEPWENKVIYYALVGSALVHLLLLAALLVFMPSVMKDKAKEIEIVYRAVTSFKKQNAGPEIASVSQIKETRKLVSRDPVGNVLDKQATSASFLKDIAKPSDPMDLAEKRPAKLPSAVEKRNISIPVVAAPKINNPKYIGYNDRIRDKIRNRAYFYIDDPRFEAGEIYLTFVVAADGHLKDLQIIDDRSRANEYLRDVGLRSVRESSPFPPFPADLNYSELSFNVVISFEVGD